MSALKILMILILLVLSVNLAACETTAKSQSGSAASTYGVQGGLDRGGSGANWTNYWGP
jgi:hypothetical protein